MPTLAPNQVNIGTAAVPNIKTVQVPVQNSAVKVDTPPQVLDGSGKPIPGAPALDPNGNIVSGSGTQSGGSFIGFGGSSATNPTVTSANTRATYDALGNDITKMFDTTVLQRNADNEAALFKSYQDKLDSGFDANTSGIKAAYDQASAQLKGDQSKRYGSASTRLVTSGGGFLGNTGSHEGNLESLNATFEQERQALMAKRDTALQAARDAYDSKNFDMAKSQLELARQVQQDIYGREKDRNDYQLQIAQENRAQSAFVQNQVDKIAASIASLSDAEFAKADPDQIRKIDEQYYPGYAKHLQEVTQKAAEIQSIKDEVSIQKDIYSMLNSIPAGRKVTIAGKTYIGLKAAAGGKSLAGAISPFTAQTVGLPAVAGLPTKDVILSLTLSRPAQWYVNAVQESEGPKSPEELQSSWDARRSDPDLQAWVNTVRLDNAHSIANDDGDLTAQIQAALGVPAAQ